MNRIGRAQDCPAYPKCALALTFTTIDVPGWTIFAFGINDSGGIVGYYVDADGTIHGFGGGYMTIDVPGSTFTRAFGINAFGEIVGDYGDAAGTSHGFVLSGGSFTTLEPPGSTESLAGGINDFGQVVGYYTDASGTTHGFLATPVPELRFARRER